jgi:hypothetical protein
MAIEIFQSPKKGGTCNIIFEKQIITPPPPPPPPPKPSLVIKKIQSPSYHGGVSDGD